MVVVDEDARRYQQGESAKRIRLRPTTEMIKVNPTKHSLQDTRKFQTSLESR